MDFPPRKLIQVAMQKGILDPQHGLEPPLAIFPVILHQIGASTSLEIDKIIHVIHHQMLICRNDWDLRNSMVGTEPIRVDDAT